MSSPREDDLTEFEFDSISFLSPLYLVVASTLTVNSVYETAFLPIHASSIIDLPSFERIVASKRDNFNNSNRG